MKTIQKIKKIITVLRYMSYLYLVGIILEPQYFISCVSAQQTNSQYDYDAGKLFNADYLEYPFIAQLGNGTYTVKLKITFHFSIWVPGELDIHFINLDNGQERIVLSDESVDQMLAGNYLLRVNYLNSTTVGINDGFKVIIAAPYDDTGLPPIVTPAPSQDQNYLITYTPRNGNFRATQAGGAAGEELSQLRVNINYYDGLGRLLQRVDLRGSSDFTKDIIMVNSYDSYGRKPKKYLPYAASSTEGTYRTDALNPANGLWEFYNPVGSSNSVLSGGIERNNFPFAEIRFEKSPLNRMLEQGAPGTDWQIGGGHTIRTNYLTNDADGISMDGGRWARRYKVNIDLSGNRTLSDEGGYGKNLLYITELKDENWSPGDGKAGITEEYKDKEGRIILKRIWKDETTPLSTYYVYDDYGNLSYVLPPKTEPDGGLPTTVTIDKLGYQYRYDAGERMIAKKVPDKDWEYIIYNKSGQVVAIQDGEQRLRNEWLITKYDGLGRIIMTGLWISNVSTEDFRSQVYNDSFQWDVKAVTRSFGYEIRTYPQNLSTVLTVNYFDNYDIPNLPIAYIRTGYANQVQGLPTATRIAVLNNTGHMLWNVNYYDNEGRIIKNISQHYLGGALADGNYDEIDNTYSFNNELLTNVRYHKVNDLEQIRISTRNEYDRMGRLAKMWHQMNSAPEVLLAEHNYNDIGILYSKTLHNGSQVTSYSYNERGWFKSSNSTELGIDLTYNSGTHPQYNGNISGQNYTNGGSNSFAYQYDKLNRLVRADASNNLGEIISYDVGGNITALNRDGFGFNTYSAYNGNKLTTISGFINSSYSYDVNGNLKRDTYKGITDIIYNHLNLPQAITGSTNVSYTYDATGRKLRKIGMSGAVDYVNGIQYNNSTIDFIQTNEGLVLNNAGNYTYRYHLTDHLGNVRTTFDIYNGAVRVLQRDDYYAFGLRKSVLNGNGAVSLENKYLYNGKELQEELEQYDYGARFYDPVIGRFNVIDRFAEKYQNLTTYQYGGNNPIKTIDVNGDSLMVITLKGLDGKNPQLRQREYYVDSEIGYQMKAFADGANEKFGLTVNNVYRSFPSSQISTGNTKAKGLSRHQGGFAVDFNGVKNLSKSQLKALNALAKEHGLAPLLNQAADLPHFDTDPTKHGYKNLKEAADENKAHYDNIQKGKAEPIKFDQKQYEEYKKKKEDENKK